MSKEERLIDFYGKDDARAYDHDTLYLMGEHAKEVSIEFLKYWNYECVGYAPEENDENKFTETYNAFLKSKQ